MTRAVTVNRARLRRLGRTFQEIHLATGSVTKSVFYTIRFCIKKTGPLVQYAVCTLTRLFVIRKLRCINQRQTLGVPALGVRVLGGVGDYIIIARFLRDLCAAIEPATFDIYSNRPKLAAWIFAAMPGFRSSFGESFFFPGNSAYTVAVQVSQFVLIEADWATADQLERFPRLLAAVTAIRHFRPSIEPIIAEHPRLDSFLAQKAIYANRARRDYLHYMAGIPYAGDRLTITFDNGVRGARNLAERRYITVHNGYDPHMAISRKPATKCYPHFGEVISLLRRRDPGILFVQVGIQTSEEIPEADIDLIGATSLAEVAGLIKGAIMHLDNESGLVHLASAMGTRSCVVFGPTSLRYFGYSANVNVAPSFCGGCWWITETWMNHCPRGFATARCLTEQPAIIIADAASSLLLSIQDGAAAKGDAGPLGVALQPQHAAE